MDRNKRKRELQKAFADVDDVKNVIAPMIDDVIFLEDKLEQLRAKLDSGDLVRGGKANPNVRIYKELLQQYNNCVKILTGVLRKDAAEEESPLRAFLKTGGANG